MIMKKILRVLVFASVGMVAVGCAKKGPQTPLPAAPDSVGTVAVPATLTPESATVIPAMESQAKAPAAPAPAPVPEEPKKVVVAAEPEPVSPTPPTVTAPEASPAPAPAPVPEEPKKVVVAAEPEPVPPPPPPVPAPKASPPPAPKPVVDYSAAWAWFPVIANAKTEYRTNGMSWWAGAPMEGVKTFVINGLKSKGIEVMDFGIPMNRPGEIGVVKGNDRYTVNFSDDGPGVVRVDVN
jgi:outer membrane biosynthesis protein TonB